MKLTLKFLDQQVMKLEVGDTSLVSDLISLVEDRMGRENMYKMIHAGKLLQEDTPLADYSISGSKLPVVVMVTKSPSDDRVPRIRTESNDSGYEEEGEKEAEKGGHYVTDAEFRISLDVVSSCGHFDRGDQRVLSEQEMKHLLQNWNNSPLEEGVRNVVFSKLNIVEEAGLTKQRFEAFVCDIQSIYQELREEVDICKYEERNDDNGDNDCYDMSFDDFSLEDEEDDKVKRLTNMGFSEEDVITALGLNFNSVILALEHLLPTEGTPQAFPYPQPNPLGFLRDIDDFQNMRFEVLHDPKLLKPLLIKFGESHPGIMAQINENKDIFVSMIHEQTGARLQGRH